MRIETDRFGALEVPDNEVLHFTEGLLGFAEYTKYVIVEQENSFFRFLQSVDEPQLAFIVIFPELIRPDYHVVLDRRQCSELQLEDEDDGTVYAIVTVPEDVAEMTANLQAPLVINTKKQLGKQIVLMDGAYSTRHNVLAEFQKTTLKQKKAKEKEELRETV